MLPLTAPTLDRRHDVPLAKKCGMPGRTIVALGRRSARAVRHVVGLTRLRAVDALYVWLAAREGLPLVTFDREILRRASLAGATAVGP
jgi:hypothetical protein